MCHGINIISGIAYAVRRTPYLHVVSEVTVVTEFGPSQLSLPG